MHLSTKQKVMLSVALFVLPILETIPYLSPRVSGFLAMNWFCVFIVLMFSYNDHTW